MTVPRFDTALIKALAQARGWLEELTSGKVKSLAEIAHREALERVRVTRITRLALLAPPIIEAIAAGHAPPALNLQQLMSKPLILPNCWRQQLRNFEMD